MTQPQDVKYKDTEDDTNHDCSSKALPLIIYDKYETYIQHIIKQLIVLWK